MYNNYKNIKQLNKNKRLIGFQFIRFCINGRVVCVCTPSCRHYPQTINKSKHNVRARHFCPLYILAEKHLSLCLQTDGEYQRSFSHSLQFLLLVGHSARRFREIAKYLLMCGSSLISADLLSIFVGPYKYVRYCSIVTRILHYDDVNMSLYIIASTS